MDNKSPCCGGKSDRECSVCFELLCPGIPKYRSVCSVCIEKCTEKDESGRFIDPGFRTPQLTCICGKRMLTGSPCMNAALNNLFSGKGEHRPIAPKGEEED